MNNEKLQPNENNAEKLSETQEGFQALTKLSWKDHLKQLFSKEKEKSEPEYYNLADNINKSLRDIAKGWDKREPKIPYEIGKMVEGVVNDSGYHFAIHRSDAIDGRDFENDGTLKSILENGLRNFGDASSGAFRANPEVAKTTTICENMLNAIIMMKSNYKGSTGALFLKFPDEYVDGDGCIRPGMEDKVYDRDPKYGCAVIKKEFIMGFMSSTPGQECTYKTREQILQSGNQSTSQN